MNRYRLVKIGIRLFICGVHIELLRSHLNKKCLAHPLTSDIILNTSNKLEQLFLQFQTLEDQFRLVTTLIRIENFFRDKSAYTG